MRSTASTAQSRGSARRLQRRLRTALTAVVLGAVAASGAVAVAPAEAAPIAPKVRLVAGAGAITAAWSGVAGATGYTVRISTKRSLSHARVLKTSKRALKITKLKNGTAYFVGVTADRSMITPATARSSVVSTKASRGVPYPVSAVSVTSGPGVDQVTVSWKGGGRALKVGVLAGSDVTTDQRTFHSPWYPATTRSITLDVPSAFRRYIGAGSGNPVWVKVVQSNSSSTAFGTRYDYTRKYRPSPIGTWAFARQDVPAAGLDRLTVAELNTQSVGSTKTFSRTNQWAQRVGRLAKLINTTSPHPAVLMTAELATNVTDSCRNTWTQPYRCASHTQVADLAKRLHGLKLADSDTYARVLDRMDVHAWDGKVTDGAHVFYDPTVLTLLDHGYYSPAMSPSDHSVQGVEGLGVPHWNPEGAVGADRWLSWAKLQVKATGRQFYAVAAHFPVGDAASVVNARAEEVTKLLAAIDRRAGGTPVVFGGDLNSDATRSPKAVQPHFIADGWFDAAAVSKKSERTGMKVSTANSSGPQHGADPGYGARPVRHPYETSRIDYILLKNSPYTFHYANVLRLTRSGAFDKSVQGTDHNMQLATIGIGDPR